MDTTVIEDKIVSLLPKAAQQKIGPLGRDDVAGSTFKTLGVSSLQLVAMIANLEEAFGIEFGDEELMGLGRQTIHGVGSMIRGKLP